MLSHTALEDFIAAFEAAHQDQGIADLAEFLPAADDALYLPVLRELVRVDLEYGWQSGRPRPLDDYAAQFPALIADAVGLRDAAFEEYRLRCQAGQCPDPAEYRRRYGVSTDGWPPPAPAAPRDTPPFPRVGSKFLSFRLLGELGQGAFGRVYLAQQDDLASRLVALKITPDRLDEAQTLAQLQHTHIVPVYSVHRHGPFRAVCMPYFGATTLADILRDLHDRPSLPTQGKDLLSTVERISFHSAAPDERNDFRSTAAASRSPELPREHLARLSYVQAVLWIGARLADGLAHAHDRGILHRDLKPANVLLTDEGQPMLLDFNLSEDVKERLPAEAARVGGTLPYMSPEQLQAFAGDGFALDGRSDVYSLGLILFQLLAGRSAFPARHGPIQAVLEQMLADRRQAPSLRPFNSAVPVGVDNVVRRCLEPDRARRYATARQLQEDLERQLANRPLRHAPEPVRERLGKWLRRHPRLASAGGVGTAAAGLLLVLVLVLAGWASRLQRFEAVENLARFRRDLPTVQFQMLDSRVAAPHRFAESAEACRALLARYRVLEHPAWMDVPPVSVLPPPDRERLREDVGRLLLLWASATLHQASAESDPDRRMARAADALPLIDAAAAAYPPGRRPGLLDRQRAAALALLGRPVEAAPEPTSAPESGRDLALLAGEHLAAGRFAAALPLLEEASRREPGDCWVWFDLGLCHEALGRDADAVACFGTCAALAPDFVPFLFKRGTALLRLGRYQQAGADLDQVIRRQPNLLDARIHRALAHEGLGQLREAIDDLAEAAVPGADSPRLFLLRAELRARLGDEAGAGRDRREGLQRRPADALGWVARAVARMDDDPAGALDDLDQALALHPSSLPALQNKAHVLAERLGRTHHAVAVLDRLLQTAPYFVPARSGRAVLLARLGRRAEAHRDLEACLTDDASPTVLYQAACVYALTSRQQPADAVEALALLRLALQRGCRPELISRDPDLEPLHREPAFRTLLERIPSLGGGP